MLDERERKHREMLNQLTKHHEGFLTRRMEMFETEKAELKVKKAEFETKKAEFEKEWEKLVCRNAALQKEL
ncbi:hypothetical protein BG011_004031 [Mortierella polycephala]|uniref:Uncharacterized protein n=1 Tax=Mortierella polycephala TaxID=41804 RepID=A0A9P6U2Y5_9FUNG|nr:hypothetical protein BG011_004031 [Mortierella polycephala]